MSTGAGGPIVHPFRACELWIWPETRYLETRFPDGHRAGAMRDCELNNAAYARHLGYRSCWSALVGHEAAHTFLAEKMGHPYSPTLHAVAHDYRAGTAPYEARLYEEALTLSFERFCLLDEMAPVLTHPQIRFHLPAWRQEFDCLRATLMAMIPDAA